MFVLYESIFQHPFFYKFLPSLTFSRRGLYIFTNVFIKEECGNMDSFFSTTQLLPVSTTWRLQPEINTHFLETSRKPPGIVFCIFPTKTVDTNLIGLEFYIKEILVYVFSCAWLLFLYMVYYDSQNMYQ